MPVITGCTSLGRPISSPYKVVVAMPAVCFTLKNPKSLSRRCGTLCRLVLVCHQRVTAYQDCIFSAFGPEDLALGHIYSGYDEICPVVQSLYAAISVLMMLGSESDAFSATPGSHRQLRHSLGYHASQWSFFVSVDWLLEEPPCSVQVSFSAICAP